MLKSLNVTLKTTAAVAVLTAGLFATTQIQAGTIVQCGGDVCTSEFSVKIGGTMVGGGLFSYEATSGDIIAFEADSATSDGVTVTTSNGGITWTSGENQLMVNSLYGNADPILGFAVAASTGAASSTFGFNFDLPIAIDGLIKATSSLGYSLSSTDGFAKISTINPTVLTAVDLDTDGPLSRLDKGVNIGTDFFFSGGGTQTTSFAAMNTFTLVPGYDMMSVQLDFGLSPNDFAGITGTVEQTVVPVPAAVWLFGSGLIGLIGVARRKIS